VLDRSEQRLVETDGHRGNALLKAQSTTQRIEQNQHNIRLTLADDSTSVRLMVTTQLANRADNGEHGEIIASDVESRRMIATNQWVRLFYRQSQANNFTPESTVNNTTKINFDDEQSLWIRVQLDKP